MNNNTDRAFQTHIAEFEAIRNEINMHMNHQNELINYAIAIIVGSASLFVFGQPSIARQEPFLLLVASLLMSGLSWSFMEASINVNNLGRYIHGQLAPKIQLLVGDVSKEQHIVMGWEDAKVTHPPTRLIMHGLTSAGKFSIAYVPSIAFLVVFYSISNPSMNPWTTLESILFGAATFAILVLPIGGLINIPFLMRFDFKSLKSHIQVLIKRFFAIRFNFKSLQFWGKNKYNETDDDN